MKTPLPFTSILRGVNNLERVKQNFHTTMGRAEHWAGQTLTLHPPDKESPDPRVEIFETKIELVKTVRPTLVPKP